MYQTPNGLMEVRLQYVTFSKQVKGCLQRTYQNKSDSNGWFIRYPEGALRFTKDSSEDKIDRIHADFLLCPHSECGQPSKTKVSPTCPSSLMFYAWNLTLREWWLQM